MSAETACMCDIIKKSCSKTGRKTRNKGILKGNGAPGEAMGSGKRKKGGEEDHNFYFKRTV